MFKYYKTEHEIIFFRIKRKSLYAYSVVVSVSFSNFIRPYTGVWLCCIITRAFTLCNLAKLHCFLEIFSRAN